MQLYAMKYLRPNKVRVVFMSTTWTPEAALITATLKSVYTSWKAGWYGSPNTCS